MGKGSEPLPQCVICLQVLSNQSMKPAFLKRHLNTQHSSLENKPREFFIRKKMEIKGSATVISSFTGSTKKAVEASFLVSLRIAKCGKAHTIGEELVLPAAKDIVKCMLGEQDAKKLGTISLSNDTVHRRINSMASNVKNILLNQVKQSKFYAIQLDESTDLTNYAQLMVYVRFAVKMEITEDILFCEPLSTRTTADEIFKKIDNFFKENGLDWHRCVGMCSDGARAMMGKYGGVAAKVKSVAPNCKFTHCSIHREALATKRMPEEFTSVLNDAVKIVNFIKAKPMNSRLFSQLCSEMGSEHIQLLLHTEVRWLSRCKMLSRLIELRSEVQLFLSETNFDLRDRFNDEVWITKLAYLADIFNRLSDLNLSLQGSTKSPFVVMNKINAMVKKLIMIKVAVSKRNFESLPILERFLLENEIEINFEVINNISCHCQMLVQSFEEYFKEDYSEYLWIRDPFLESPPESLSLADKEALIELSCDSSLQTEFKNIGLCEFWLNRESEYNSLSTKALKFLLPFTSTYLCESGFSAMLAIKNKYRSKLNLEPSLRLKLSKIEPDIKMLISEMQIQPSH